MDVPDYKTRVVTNLVEANSERIRVGRGEAESIACPRIASGQGYNDAFLGALRGFKAQEIDASVAESDCDKIVQDRIR